MLRELYMYHLVQLVRDSIIWQVPGGPNSTLVVSGLKPNEEYVFAVAAYDDLGQLMGQQSGQILGRSSLQMGQLSGRLTGSIGETGRPIVACHSLPILLAWGHCCQVFRLVIIAWKNSLSLPLSSLFLLILSPLSLSLFPLSSLLPSMLHVCSVHSWLG